MLTIIHGDDVIKSRAYFSDQKKRFQDTASFTGQTINLTDLAQIIEGSGLFVEQKAIFIEELLSKKKASSSEVHAIVEYLAKAPEEIEIFLWEGKELQRNNLTNIKNASIKLFAYPKHLFVFLDSIKPNNTIQLLSQFHKTIETVEEEVVFFMLVRQFRLLLALKDKKTSIEEIKRMASWQKLKLEKQSNLFTSEKIIVIYQKLYQLDYQQKTGQLTTSVRAAIDFLLLEI